MVTTCCPAHPDPSTLVQVLGELATQERLVMHQVAGRREAVSFAKRQQGASQSVRDRRVERPAYHVRRDEERHGAEAYPPFHSEVDDFGVSSMSTMANSGRMHPRFRRIVRWKNLSTSTKPSTVHVRLSLLNVQEVMMCGLKEEEECGGWRCRRT